MSIVEYVRDPRFKVFGAGVAELESETRWYTADDLHMFFAAYGQMAGGWENVAVVGHNIKFDGFILKEAYGVTPGQWIDTKGMSKAVLGKTVKSHSLASLASFFGLQSKGIMKTDGIKDLTTADEAALADYCLHDVWLCREIFKRLDDMFPENQYQVLHQTINMFVNPKLILNVPLLEKTATEEMTRRANIFKEIRIDKKEFASNKKFPELLIKKGYEVPTKSSPRTGKDIPALALGDVEFLEMLEGENEELKALCEARVAAKSTLLETRSAKLAKIGATGAWPFDVEFSGADQTHRFSGGGGAGGNPQNFTRGSALREAVEAPPGFSLVVGDFSQVEFRIVAYLAKDPGLIGLIESGNDFYCDYASLYYGCRITKADVDKRMFGKEALLGLGYNMGAKKFKNRIKIKTGQVISAEDAWKAVDLYRTRYSYVPKLWESLASFIPAMTHKDTKISPPDLPITFVHEGFLLPSGLKVRFPNLRQEMNEKRQTEWVYDIWNKGQFEKRKLYGGKILENISQGIAGELCKLAMVEMGESVVGQVHDELIILAPNALISLVKAKLQRLMSVSPDWFSKIKLEAETGFSNNWKDAK